MCAKEKTKVGLVTMTTGTGLQRAYQRNDLGLDPRPKSCSIALYDDRGDIYGNQKSPLSCRSSGSLQNIFETIRAIGTIRTIKWKPGLTCIAQVTLKTIYNTLLVYDLWLCLVYFKYFNKNVVFIITFQTCSLCVH